VERLDHVRAGRQFGDVTGERAAGPDPEHADAVLHRVCRVDERDARQVRSRAQRLLDAGPRDREKHRVGTVGHVGDGTRDAAHAVRYGLCPVCRASADRDVVSGPGPARGESRGEASGAENSDSHAVDGRWTDTHRTVRVGRATMVFMGTDRRRALRAGIGGISDKALTETLNRLLGNGLIERRSFAEAPPRVDYSLTDLGRSFADGPMRALGAWVVEYGDELFEAQERSA
jgi:DNA-binding HxlR family transcriptional regulator